MHSCIILLAVLVVVRSMHLTFTKVSYATSGKPCFNDCTNNECFTALSKFSESQFIVETCIPGNETAPIYHTSMMTSTESTCTTRCATSGEDTEWCYVSNNLGNVDFCSSETRIIWRKGYKTLHGRTCYDECKMDDSYEDYRCTVDLYENKDECDPKEYSYVQAKTIFGHKCVSECLIHDDYYNCDDEETYRSPCAQPAIPPALRELHEEESAIAFEENNYI